MTSKQLFTKKTLKNDGDESQDETLQPLEEETTPPAKSKSKAGSNKTKEKDSTLKKVTKEVEDENGTVRLSCDLSRRYHTLLRVAAAFSERSILGMIEILIAKHLMGKPTDQIISEYRKNTDVECTRIR